MFSLSKWASRFSASLIASAKVSDACDVIMLVLYPQINLLIALTPRASLPAHLSYPSEANGFIGIFGAGHNLLWLPLQTTTQDCPGDCPIKLVALVVGDKLPPLRNNRAAKVIQHLLPPSLSGEEIALTKPCCHDEHMFDHVLPIMDVSGHECFAPLTRTSQEISLRCS